MKKNLFSLLLALGIIFYFILTPMILNSPILRESSFTTLMYIALAISLNILMGFTGYVSFGHVVFFGIGGYITFALLYYYKISLFLALILAGIFAALIAALLGSVVLNLRGAYFAIATIGINEAIKSLVNNLEFLGGAEGLFFNMKIYKSYGGPQNALWLSFYLLGIITIVVLIISYLIKHSKFGLGLFAIREDEDAASTLGVNTKLFKTIAFMISAFFPAVVGGIFFFKNGSIDPGSAFSLTKSVEMIFMVMLGGIGTILGPVLGAITYDKIKETLLVSEAFKNLHLTISGIILLLIVLFVPEGIIGFLRRKIKVLKNILD
ncbi:MAG TPA: branched-chain amino acid ABC transporter permease [Desulfurobacteriaceae bacterium]|nr:branched-chain amino acid ABC transporter permease [Desulfurobacteriaceae bacterium]